jgi:hypothetical protein
MKQRGTPVAMSVATEPLMLPLLRAMDATKKGMLAFVGRLGWSPCRTSRKKPQRTACREWFQP